jgi:hypothetical protein
MPEPGGAPTQSINAAIGIAPVDVGEMNRVLGSATERLNEAYKTGVVTFNDVMDAATTRPKAREALMKQLDLQGAAAESGLKDVLAKEAARPQMEQLQTNKLEAESRQARLANAIGAATERALVENPGTVDEIGRNAALGMAQQSMLTKGALDLQLGEIARALDDPYGTLDNAHQVLGKSGIYLPPGTPREDVYARLRKLNVDTQAAKLESEVLLKQIDQIAKSQASARDKSVEIHGRVEANEHVKAAREVIAQGATIRKLAAMESPTAASDMAMVFSFMKIMDPTSVVREGEYANAQRAQGLIDRYSLGHMWDRLSKGLILTPEQRTEFVGAANEALRSRASMGARVVADAKENFHRNGGDPDTITVDLDPGLTGLKFRSQLPANLKPGPGETLRVIEVPPGHAYNKNGTAPVIRVERVSASGAVSLVDGVPGMDLPDGSFDKGGVQKFRLDNGAPKYRISDLPREIQEIFEKEDQSREDKPRADAGRFSKELLGVFGLA